MRYRFLCFPEGKQKAVTFSYDDGVRSDIRLTEIFKKYNAKGTFNINSGMIPEKSGEKRITANEIEEFILNRGHEVAVHGDLHCAPGVSSPLKITKDVLDCRLKLEELFSRIIRGMAYPDSGVTNFQNGTDYETVKTILCNLGITYSRSLSNDNNSFKLPTDWHNWIPTCHHNNPHALEWAKEFAELDFENSPSLYGAHRWPKLFYVWGHSYEFDNNDNWERIEQLCEILCNKEDTWYATNGEICEYVKAYESLVFSVDDSMVYNPTSQKIWFETDGVKYCVGAGETLKI